MDCLGGRTLPPEAALIMRDGVAPSKCPAQPAPPVAVMMSRSLR
jgi:hypothetical protein